MKGAVQRGFWRRLGLLTLCAGLLFACLLLRTPCIFRAVTGIPCLGCGLTRAWLAAFRLDFVMAFSYHPMFWGVPVAAVLYLLVGEKTPNWCRCVYVLLGTAFVVCYVIRLVAHFTGQSVV